MTLSLPLCVAVVESKANRWGTEGGENPHPLQRLRGGGRSSGLRQTGGQTLDAPYWRRQGEAYHTNKIIHFSRTGCTKLFITIGFSECFFSLGCDKEGTEWVQKHRDGGARVKSASNQVTLWTHERPGLTPLPCRHNTHQLSYSVFQVSQTIVLIAEQNHRALPMTNSPLGCRV